MCPPIEPVLFMHPTSQPRRIALGGIGGGSGARSSGVSSGLRGGTRSGGVRSGLRGGVNETAEAGGTTTGDTQAQEAEHHDAQGDTATRSGGQEVHSPFLKFDDEAKMRKFRTELHKKTSRENKKNEKAVPSDPSTISKADALKYSYDAYQKAFEKHTQYAEKVGMDIAVDQHLVKSLDGKIRALVGDHVVQYKGSQVALKDLDPDEIRHILSYEFQAAKENNTEHPLADCKNALGHLFAERDTANMRIHSNLELASQHQQYAQICQNLSRIRHTKLGTMWRLMKSQANPQGVFNVLMIGMNVVFLPAMFQQIWQMCSSGHHDSSADLPAPPAKQMATGAAESANNQNQQGGPQGNPYAAYSAGGYNPQSTTA